VKPHIPAKNIAMIADHEDMAGFRTICECTNENHSVDTWIEVENFEDTKTIIVSFHINTYQHPFARNFWHRIKNAFKVLIGVDQRSQEIILNQQQAINWCKAVETTVKRIEKMTL
jgi:hypothetical protein